MCVEGNLVFLRFIFFSVHVCVCVEGLYERRRSLRVKGLEPEEKGFDYYAASRTPRKQREGGCEGVGGEGGEGEGGCEGVSGEREGESDDVLESGYEDDDEREGEGEMREREIRERERVEKRGTSSGRLRGNLADSRMETGESESDPNNEMEEGVNHRGNDLSSGRNATSENSVKRRSNKRRNGNGHSTEPAGSETTVVSIQRNLRRTPRVKLQPFPGNRETRSPVAAVGNERCNDDIITSGVQRDICQSRSEDRVNGSFSSPSNYVGGSAHRKNRSHSSSVSMETVSRVRSKVIVISDDKSSSVDTGVVAVATGKKSKSVPVAAGDGVGRGGVACDGVMVGREVVCNGVGRPSSDLWLGGGGAEAESALRDVLVGMETESERERNSNSKSTHSSTGPSRQVSNSKSAPNPTSTTTRQKSNSNPNLKSAPSVSTTTTTTTAHSSSLRRNQSEEEEERQRQEIDVDTSKLVAMFDRVISESGEVSVEVMEKMLSTFNHLVFRYRMRSDRRQLPRVRKGLNLLCVV